VSSGDASASLNFRNALLFAFFVTAIPLTRDGSRIFDFFRRQKQQYTPTAAPDSTTTAVPEMAAAMIRLDDLDGADGLGVGRME
jgi:hypothetical protein